jgi:hypothetical protein
MPEQEHMPTSGKIRPSPEYPQNKERTGRLRNSVLLSKRVFQQLNVACVRLGDCWGIQEKADGGAMGGLGEVDRTPSGNSENCDRAYFYSLSGIDTGRRGAQKHQTIEGT